MVTENKNVIGSGGEQRLFSFLELEYDFYLTK